MRLELVCLVFATVGFALDCKSEKCFGQPEGCDVHNNCRTVFNFDNEGNLDLHLRGVFDEKAYVAFPLKKENGVTTYIICLPHENESYKAYAEFNRPIKIVDVSIAKNIRSIDQKDFTFSFPASQLTPNFEQNRNFYITTGKFVDNLVIEDGQNGYSFVEKDNSAEDADYETELSAPISGNIKRTDRLTEDVYTGVDSKQANDAINAIESIASKKTDSNFEDEVDSVMEKEKSPRKSKGSRNDETREEEEEEEEKKPRQPIRANRKTSTRSSKRRDEEEEIEEGDEDEDWEAAARELERKDRRNAKSRRRQNQEDDDEDRPRNRNSKKRPRNDEDDYEEEDEDDAAFANFDIFLCTSIVIIVFGFLF